MEGASYQPLSVSVFTSYGAQLQKERSWYSQERCNEWPHLTSALTLGESSVVKFGVSYPLRTGLNSPADPAKPDFLITTSFTPLDDSLHEKVVEEIHLNRGVCIISHGPLGGPSFLKGLYRPLISYGTGVGISQVVKAKFTKPTFTSAFSDEADTESFICLCERGGVSIYAEDSAETHVSHVPEFQIGKIIPCKFGLLVLPSEFKKDSVTDYSKKIYILTHPVKQVSKLWIKARPGHDFTEYDSSEEKLVRCEEDICIFWSVKNDKIFIRRLLALDKQEVLQLSTLNATMCHSSPELSSKNFQLNPGLHGNSPLHLQKQPFTRSAAMKANRDAGGFVYWPPFDFNSNGNSSTSSLGMGHGFYPPHVCIYDDPELYLKQLFQIDLPKSLWKDPKKFCLMRDACNPSKVALWFLIKNNLHSYGIDIDSGTKLGNYSIKNVEDFAIPTGPDSLPVVIYLDTSGKLSLGWLDGNFKLIVTTFLTIFSGSSPHLESYNILGVEGMLFGDTILCTVEKSTYRSFELPDRKYLKVQLRNYKKDCLTRNCMETFFNDFESEITTKLISHLTCNDGVSLTNFNKSSHTDQSCQHLLQAIQAVILSSTPNDQLRLGKRFIKAIASFKEDFSVSAYFSSILPKLDFLISELTLVMKSQFPEETLDQDIRALLPTFGYLLLHSKSSLLPEFETIPEVLQILVDNPDSFDHIEKLVKIEREENLIPLIHLLIADVCHRNSGCMHFDAPLNILIATGRLDYLSGRDTSSIGQSMREEWVNPPVETVIPMIVDSCEDSVWMDRILSMKIFSDDRRLEEVCRLLDSCDPVVIESEQKAEMSDHEFVEEQEKNLLQLIQINFSAPVGRTALTLKTDDSPYTSLTSSIHIPKLSFAGKCKGKGTAIELSETELPVAYTNWPHFHNVVGAAMSVRFAEIPAEAWFAFNKSRVNEGPEQAGMVLGLGLNGILSAMPPTLRHEYLSKENSFTTMSMLLGLAANLRGTADMSIWKLISLHIGAMLPACTTELEIPRLATLVAPTALGLLFLGTQNTFVAKVLLGEMSKKFTPLSCFGSSSNNNSASVANPHENTGTTTDREAHSLCAGLGLGFVNLGKGKVRMSGFADDDFDGILRRFVVGGPKPAQLQGDEGEGYNNQADQALPSVWEEYRCCHIEEGDNVNVDVTTPSAIIAVALTYLRTGNEAVLNWLSPPETLHLLDGVRPDLLLLRSLVSVLVFERLDCPDVSFLENSLMPRTLLQNALQEPVELSRINHESVNQCWASIACGYCIGLGIRYAGTSDHIVMKSIRYYIDLFMQLSAKESKLCEFFPKNFLESCICNLVLASALVVAGTGEISILRFCRYLQRKVSLTPVNANYTTYGLEMCISMATGILFLGGGRYSLSNDDRSIAMILAAVFPKWPINANDNRYHLQALRHLYVLAAEPRLIFPKPMPQASVFNIQIEFSDGTVTTSPAPLLLPPFHLLRKIRLDNDEFFPIEFNLPKDLPYLTRIVNNKGILNLVKKPVARANYGFVREMSWRKDTNYHPMFGVDEFTPPEEKQRISEFDLVHQLAEWSGMKEIVSPVLTMLHANPADENMKWQIRILHWWTEMSAWKNIPTCFPPDLLLLLRKRGDRLIDITKPTAPPLRSISG